MAREKLKVFICMYFIDYGMCSHCGISPLQARSANHVYWDLSE